MTEHAATEGKPQPNCLNSNDTRQAFSWFHACPAALPKGISVIVCGKCGSSSIYGLKNGVTDAKEITAMSLSCIKCGNTSESKKYGFREVEEEMKPIGTCSNCLRPNMKVSAKSANAICGSCTAAIGGTKAGSPEREAKLAEAKEKYQGKKKMYRGRHKTIIMGGAVKNGNGGKSITLDFVDDTDFKILNHIESEAKRLRRTPTQQALWMLQSIVEGNEVNHAG